MPMIHLRFHLCNRLFLVWSTLGRRGETAFNRIGGLLLAAALAPAAHAATCTSNGAGINWNTAANWTCAPAPVNKVPAAADIVIINSNMTVNANTANLASVTINNGFTLTQSRDLNMTGALNVAGILNSSDTMFIGGPTTISGPSPAAALNIVTTGGNHTFAGLVTIDADGTWNNSANEAVVFRGGIAFNGDAFNAGTAVQTFNTNAQSISGTLSIPRITVTGVTLANNGNLTVSTTLTGSGTFANGTGPASTATLTLGMQTVGINNLTAGVSGNSVLYNRAGNQTIERPAGSTYHHLVLDGSGTKTVPGGTIAINGNMTIDAGVTYNGTTNDPDIDLAGNFSNNGTFNAGTGVFTFVGGVPQALGGTAATTFEELTIGKSAGNVTISCGTPSPAVDNGTLTLAGGKIITSGTSASSCSTACSDQVPLIIGLAGTIDGGGSASYIHTLYQTMNLAFADRDFYYGDPAFPPEEPMRGLLSKEYAKARATLVNPDRNDPSAKPGDPYPYQGGTNPFRRYLDAWPPPDKPVRISGSHVDGTSWEDAFYAGTTSIQAADEQGWVISITPSGGWIPAVVAGRTGVGLSQRAQSFVFDPAENPFNVMEPGKRPRVTLTPTLAMKDGLPWMAFSVQGGDSQDQNLLQYFLNIVEFGMTPQQAVEAPNMNSFQMRNSFQDHTSQPGRMLVASSTTQAIRAELQKMGYRLQFAERTSGPITAIWFDRTHGTMWGAASNHGEDYGIVW